MNSFEKVSCHARAWTYVCILSAMDMVPLWLIELGKCVENTSFYHRAVPVRPTGKWQRAGIFFHPLCLFLFGAALLTDNVTLPTQPLSQAGITSFISRGSHFSVFADYNAPSLMFTFLRIYFLKSQHYSDSVLRKGRREGVLF